MRILLALDLLLAYIRKKDYIDGLDLLFLWLDKLGCECCIDLASVAAITHFATPDTLSRLNRFSFLMEVPQKGSKIQTLEELVFHYDKLKKVDNLRTLLPHLAWIDNGRIDYLLTENPSLHQLSTLIGLDNRVYRIENFIEKCATEHRNLDPFKGAVVKRVKMGSLCYEDAFLDTFREEYGSYYPIWFHKKAQDDAYVAIDSQGCLRALLKLKTEGEDENYSDIKPTFVPAKRLKICSLKVDYNGQRIGERFMRIIFETSLREKVDEIYVTVFNNSRLRKRMTSMILTWGFVLQGRKTNGEEVYVRRLRQKNLSSQKKFPFCHYENSAYILPIQESYASDLIPDTSIVEDMDVEPYKRAIKKVVVLNGDDKQLQEGSLLLFLRVSANKERNGIIAIGTVERVIRNINTEKQFILSCRKRSCLMDSQLRDIWKRQTSKKVVVEFLYNYSFAKSMIVKEPALRYAHATEVQLPHYISKEEYKQLIRGTAYERYIDFD